jgi:hypothetical protein
MMGSMQMVIIHTLPMYRPIVRAVLLLHAISAVQGLSTGRAVNVTFTAMTPLTERLTVNHYFKGF